MRATRRRRSGRGSAIVGVLALVGLMVPAAPAPADHTSPVVSCDFLGIVISTPGPFGSGGAGGAGNFGGASIGGTFIGSKLVCSGAVNGTADLSGGFATCVQLDDAGTVRHPGPSNDGQVEPWDPNNAKPAAAVAAGETAGFACNGEYAWDSTHVVFNEELVDAANPCDPTGMIVCHPNVHVAGVGLLDGQDWVWDNGNVAPDCEFAFSGHAPSPVELEVLVSCPAGGTPDHLITFHRPNGIGFAPLFGAAADLFHVNTDEDGPDFQHCEVSDASHDHKDEDGNPTTQTWVEENNPLPHDRLRCSRATVFNGVLTGTVAGI